MSERSDLMKRQETMPDATSEIPAVAPLVDIYENDDEILLHADMPGVIRDDITVSIDNGKLTLTGTRKIETTGAAQWEEFGNVEYRRNFSVPQTIDVAGINAVLKDGVLRLHLPKSEAARPKQIEIKAA
ncbi:MAG: Hsp20/alpha crystallin family protein [Desulfobulbaceae bacterium]|nr:Hsp20/alpha crystallin family protein [Desulfobulbaceae bacterium]